MNQPGRPVNLEHPQFKFISVWKHQGLLDLPKIPLWGKKIKSSTLLKQTYKHKCLISPVSCISSTVLQSAPVYEPASSFMKCPCLVHLSCSFTCLLWESVSLWPASWLFIVRICGCVTPSSVPWSRPRETPAGQCPWPLPVKITTPWHSLPCAALFFSNHFISIAFAWQSWGLFVFIPCYLLRI